MIELFVSVGITLENSKILELPSFLNIAFGILASIIRIMKASNILKVRIISNNEMRNVALFVLKLTIFQKLKEAILFAGESFDPISIDDNELCKVVSLSLFFDLSEEARITAAMHIDRLQYKFDALILAHLVNVIILGITFAEDGIPFLKYPFSSTQKPYLPRCPSYRTRIPLSSHT